MKYENFGAASSICIKINQKQAELNELNDNQIIIRVAKDRDNGLYTIGADASYEHAFTPLAVEFLDKIKASLQADIDKLKTELEAL